jgi:hypothetical protein
MRPTPGPQLVAVPVSGAEGGSALRKRSEATTTPLPRAVLFYTLLELLTALTQELTATH